MDQITRIFIDTSKTVFQLHGVNAAEEPVLRRKLRRSQVLEFFAKLEPVLIGLEACAGRGPRSPWLLALLARKEPKEAAVALANKVARIAWRMMLSGHDYDPERLLRAAPAAAA